MRSANARIIIVLAVLEAGCALTRKSPKQVAATPAPPKPIAAAPAPPPPPLSIPQTQVELPRPQPLDPAALVTEPVQQPETPIETPKAGAQSQGSRRPASRGEGASQPGAAGQTPVVPPAVGPTESAAPTIREIMKPEETKRLRDQASAARRDAKTIVDQLSRRNLTTSQREVIANINSFIESSETADKQGDVKTAQALAERAKVLAEGLANAK